MFLSQLILNPRSRQVRRELGNPYEMHRTLMQAFPDKEAGGPGRVLFRMEQPSPANRQRLTLLVQSTLEPDWSAVDRQYLAEADPVGFLPNPAVKSLKLPLQVGQVLSFRLCANPTIKKVRRDENGERRNSNRVPLVHEEKQLAWLQQRAEAGGFQVLRVTVSQPQQQTAWKKENKRPITLYTVRFDGHLRVVEPDKLLAAVKNGIGPAKAFGCGLLSLGPA